MTSYNRTLTTPAGYSGDFVSGRQVLSSKVYIGKIKDNRDILSMGRLRVWIRDLDPDENHEAGWQTVSYCSPFAGATPIRNQDGRLSAKSKDGKLIAGSNTFDSTQKTYGWWAVPPDLDNLVLCVFADGQQTQGFWIGCVFQEQMNQMVPAIGTDDNKEPKAEYDRKDTSAAKSGPLTPDRPEHTTLKEGLRTQGLLIEGGKIDFDRGLATASARRKFDHGTGTSTTQILGHRDQAAKVYGFLSPAGTQLVFDDLEDQEYVRLRTKTGAQITIHEGTGFVYLINKDGTAWVELAADGNIDVYSNVSVNIRAEQDINLRADRDVNIESGRNINMKAIGETTPGNIKIEAKNNMDITVDNDITIFAGDDYNLRVVGNMFEESDNKNVKVLTTTRIETSNYFFNSTRFDANTGTYNLSTTGHNLNVSGSRNTFVSGSEVKFTGGGFGWANASVHMKLDTGGSGGFDNTSIPEKPFVASTAFRPLTNSKINIDFNAALKTFIEEKKQTIVTRFPTHEPYPEHIRKARALEIPKEVKVGVSNLLPGQTSLEQDKSLNVKGGLVPGGDIGDYIGESYLNDLAQYTRVGDVVLVPASQLGVGEAGLNLIAEKEGFIAFARPDIGGGAQVIAFGHTLTPEELKTGLINVSGTNIKWIDGLSKTQGLALLNQDVTSRFAPIIERNVLVDINQNQKDALISFVYNVGETNFTTSTLLKRLNTGDHSSVSDELMRWIYATDPKTGTKIQFNGLITRRQAEADLFSS